MCACAHPDFTDPDSLLATHAVHLHAHSRHALAQIHLGAVLGLLLGVQSGRHVELFNSFEMVAEVVADADGKPLIQFEAEFLKDKLVSWSVGRRAHSRGSVCVCARA